MRRFTGPLPFWVEPHRHEQERKDLNPVERLWRPPALPGAHSCLRVSGGNRTRRQGLHRALCQPLHHRHHAVVPAGFEPAIFPMSWECPARWTTGLSVPRPGFEPGTPRSKRGMMILFTIEVKSCEDARVARVGVEPTDKSRRSELRRFPGLRTVPFPWLSVPDGI